MKKILIVEDDLTIGEVEKDYLEMAGFDVTLVQNGKEGLALALTHGFDLVILDVMLPDQDGLNIARNYREASDKPIIMVTAKDKEVDKIRGFAIGIDDYVTKPFSPAELVARSIAHIKRYDALKARPSVSSDDRIEIRGLVIERDQRLVYMNGEVVDLTPKEYDLLLLLAQAPGKVFTKEEIFEKVWGFSADQDIPTITVHIRKLREKLEFIPAKPEYLLTVWGVGYKMVK